MTKPELKAMIKDIMAHYLRERDTVSRIRSLVLVMIPDNEPFPADCVLSESIEEVTASMVEHLFKE